MTTETPNAVPPLETDNEMDPIDSSLKQVGRLANSSSDTVLKYITIVVIAMILTLFYFQWERDSSASPKLIDLLERQVNSLGSSLKIQEESLREIQKFSIQVPMEHRDLASKQSVTDEKVSRMSAEQSELRAAIKANSDAVQKNTEAVARLVQVIEVRITQDSSPNVQQPPK